MPTLSNPLATVQRLTTELKGPDNPHYARRRGAQLNMLLHAGVALKAEITEMEEKLERGYDWLEQHPDDANEQRWVEWLHDYEARCDALRAAEGAL